MKRLLFISLTIILISGCASTSTLRNLSIGMSKNEVVEILGEPVTTHASDRHYGGIEIWDYIFREHGNPLSKRQRYWVYFKENEVIQWGKEGDWGDLEREPDYIEKLILEDETIKRKEPRFH